MKVRKFKKKIYKLKIEINISNKIQEIFKIF